MAYKYFPVVRARQQEMDVLSKFDFGNAMVPIVEIIKAKDRKNNEADGDEIYTGLFNSITAEKVLVDLPIYLEPSVSTSHEVRKFFLSTTSNLTARIDYIKKFAALQPKLVPVISVLSPFSDEADTLITQFNELSVLFPQLAVRIFVNKYDDTLSELKRIILRDGDLLLYDLDTVNITSPLVLKHKRELDQLYPGHFKTIIRSAINTDIQNVKLQHGEIIAEADNSLLTFYKMTPQYGFPSFGDYAGVKKDDITSGGTVSPGFIFYNPDENLYYGFRGANKLLSDFETSIVPDVLAMPFVVAWVAINSPYIQNNPGFDKLLALSRG
ncbi:MAG: hypothetical protein IT241_03700, partial [Bacteroidia bacterium]|nr:hypothetical protein [Bacteroidia bacterium]